MINDTYIRLGMFVNSNVRLHFLYTSHVIQFLKNGTIFIWYTYHTNNVQLCIVI